VSVEPSTGRARFHAQNVAIRDFHDIMSAVTGSGPAPRPSHVTFDVRWAGGGKARPIRDRRFGFSGRYIRGPATITFSATDDATGVTWTSDATGQRNPTAAEGGAGSPAVGRERNGMFF
jgi:hypothetical protein